MMFLSSVPDAVDHEIAFMNQGVQDFNLSTDTAILAAFYRDQGGALRELLSSESMLTTARG